MDREPDAPDPALPVPDLSSYPLTTLASRLPPPLLSESDGPDADDDDEVDYSPPRKRKKGCPSSAGISASVRAKVIKQADGKCWLCGLHGSHIAHVIPSSETDLLAEYKLSGLLHMDSLNELQNLMFLCAGCHYAFDARVPIWVFLPITLDAFISRENAFYVARADAASLGHALSRPDPRNGKMKPLYYGRYQIRPNYVHDVSFIAQPIKRWFGSPIAAILRSAGILAGVQRLDPLTRGGLPEDVARKLHELLFLYGVQPPPVQRIVRKLELGDLPAWPELPHHDHKMRPPPIAAPPNTPCETKGRGTAHPATGHKDVQKQHHIRLTPPRPIPVVRRKRCRHHHLSKWVFGPKMTSNMAIEWSKNSLGMELDDEAENTEGVVEK